MFSVECGAINILPPQSTVFSRYASTYSTTDVWCTRLYDSSPNANMTFSEPLYLLFAIVRGNRYGYVTKYSLKYENSSGENVTYMNVDGNSVRCFIKCRS